MTDKKPKPKKKRPTQDKAMRMIKLIGELISTAIVIRDVLKKPPKEHRRSIDKAKKKLVDYSHKINHIVL